MLITLLLGNSVLAFAPDEDTFIGQEPVRVRRYHPGRQHTLRRSEGWVSFTEGDGAGWKARFDERTGTAHRAWGPGIDLGDFSTAEEAAAAVLAVLKRHPSLIGVSIESLSFSQGGLDDASGTWFIELERVVTSDTAEGPLDGLSMHSGGVPVWRGGVQARIKEGRLMMLGIDTHPGATGLSLSPTLSSAAAMAAAVSGGPAPNSIHEDDYAELVILPVEQGSGIAYTLCWEVHSTTASPVGQWVTFVDAHTGALHNVHNQVRFLSGDLHGEHDVRTVDGEMTTSALGGVFLDAADGESSEVSADGTWSMSSDWVDASLNSDGVRVRDDGNIATMTLAAGENTWTEAQATQAEIDTYVFLHQIRDWAADYAPHVNSSWSRINSNVNLDSSCNAYFDGDVNFYTAGSGCNNTARIADVNYHEWGHGFHYYNLISGSWDGSISEGIGDSVAFFLTEDSVISPYFYTSGSGIRDASPDRVYPEDWVGEVHYDGLIFAGAVWDLWRLMSAEMGEEAAKETLFPLFVSALRGGPEIPDAYDEFIAADDDNGDLSDGTPNQCAIIDAFSRHGLGPGGNAALFSLTTAPLGNQAAGVEAYPIEADLLNLAEGCTDFSIDTAEVRYSIDGGDTWQSATLTGEDTVVGAIPAQEAGTVVDYYLSAASTDGDQVNAPAGGAITPLSFYVGELVEIYCNDFEDDDGGFTSELLSGESSAGADDWMWGTPNGMGGDPDFSHSGDNVWGNDLGGTIDGESYNGEYQNEKHNRLTSPAIGLEGYETVVVQFQRWLNVEDGYYDQANVLINEEVVWDNHATQYDIGDEHHQDSQWALQSITLDATEITELSLGWEIISDEGLSMGGWNVDDVCIYGVEAPANGPGLDDSDDGKLGARGCGCASVSQPASLVGLLWIAGVALLRRRR